MAILQEALQQPPEERPAYLRAACGGDDELCRELGDALRWEERMGRFLLEPLVDFSLLVRPFEPGQTIGEGRFEILREIGEGGMGVVYEAFDRKLQQNIALKAAKPGFQRLLSPELKAALKVRHQNICLVKEIHTAQTDYGEVDFLAMELLEGETLSAHLAKAGRLSHEEALGIACQVCAGLAEAHRSGIIHRDLKNSNVILCQNDDGSRRAVITDFGLAGGTAITSGEVAGTPAYMAPELWRGEPPSKASDVYALGIMLYETVAGRRPYKAEDSSDELGTTGPLLCSLTEEQWHHRDDTETPPPPSTFVKHLDPRWDRVIMRCLQPLPIQRPEAGEVLAQLQRKRLSKALFVVPVLLILVLTAIVALVRPVRQWAIGSLSRPHIPYPKERQITANPIEDWVVAAGLSTDGKQVAYKDNTGLYLRSIDSDETRPISLPAELVDPMYSVLWVPYREQLLAGVGSANGFDLWLISLSGEPKPSLLYRNADSAAISPDGRSIVFVSSEFGHSRHELWVGTRNGDAPRKLLDVGATGEVFAPTWSPDGHSIAYARQWKTTNGSLSVAIEVRPAIGGSAKTLVDEGSLPESDSFIPNNGLAWTPDGRLLFLLRRGKREGLVRSEVSLWQVRVNSTTEAADRPTQLTQWSEFTFSDFSVSRDGRRLLVVKSKFSGDLYLAKLDLNNFAIKAPRRLTLHSRGVGLCAWTPDSQRILFHSTRNGKSEILEQGVSENVGQRVVEDSADLSCADLSPDGKWLLYWRPEDTGGGGTRSQSKSLVRRPMRGGPSEKVLTSTTEDPVSCSSNPAAPNPCVLGRREGKDLVFYSLDPVTGTGSRMGKIEVGDPPSGVGSWSLSPDGKRLAFVDGRRYGHRVELLTLANGTWHQVETEAQGQQFLSITWAADGNGFFVGSWTPASWSLFHVTIAGKVHELLPGGRTQIVHHPLASRDGKYVVFESATADSNVWLIDNF